MRSATAGTAPRTSASAPAASSINGRWARSRSQGARALLRLCLALGVASSAWAVRPPDNPDARALLKQLDEVTVDPAQIYMLRHVEISRDRLKIYFNRGFVALFAPVAGEITGAVFSGDGEILLIPPSAAEKRNLAQFTHSPILEERFDQAYLRFTDQTAKELLAQAARPDPDDPDQPTGLAERWAPLVRQLNPSHSMRVLQDLLGERDLPYFQVWMQGLTLGAFEASDDERAPEAVRVGTAKPVGGRLFADVWCSFPSRAPERRGASETSGSAVARSYKIETRINDDNSLDGRAEIELESESSRDRLVSFELSSRLKVSAVSEEGANGAQNLTFFQSPSPEESTTAARGNNWVVAVLPVPHPAGTRFRLDFTYGGNVIADVGSGVLYVGARGSWYPNRVPLGATYDLTFQYPERLTLVATGRRVGETTAAGWKHSRWISDGTFPVAGFNLGAYEERTRLAGSTRIEAYAASGVERSLERRELNAQAPDFKPGRATADPIPPRPERLDPRALLDSVSDRAAEDVRYFETLFGPFPYPRLALSQVPGDFGQGWPELVYLPTLSFLPSSARSELGDKQADNLENQLFIAHEIAHQWWGNRVGWKTYHDQWISEGFASYAAALELARGQEGEQKFHQLMRDYKRDLLSKTKDGDTVESGGPIWLGERLTNSLNPSGYNAIVYKKACWVLHMLRLMMDGSQPGAARGGPVADPKEKFFRMLREFAATYQDKNASTEDFVKQTEKYMTPALDLDHNHRLGWFFEDWVYSTGVPSYHLESTVRRLGASSYVIQGSVEQSGVSNDFEMPVPLVAVYGKRVVPLGRVVVSDAGGRFRFTVPAKPSHVAIDEDQILAVLR